MRYDLKIPITSLGKGQQKLTLLNGSHAIFEVILDVCIDGTADVGVWRTKTDLLAKSEVPTPQGGTADFTLTVLIDVLEIRKEPLRK